jgi:hypothetical protein
VDARPLVADGFGHGGQALSATMDAGSTQNRDLDALLEERPLPPDLEATVLRMRRHSAAVVVGRRWPDGETGAILTPRIGRRRTGRQEQCRHVRGDRADAGAEAGMTARTEWHLAAPDNNLACNNRRGMPKEAQP